MEARIRLRVDAPRRFTAGWEPPGGPGTHRRSAGKTDLMTTAIAPRRLRRTVLAGAMLAGTVLAAVMPTAASADRPARAAASTERSRARSLRRARSSRACRERAIRPRAVTSARRHRPPVRRRADRQDHASSRTASSCRPRSSTSRTWSRRAASRASWGSPSTRASRPTASSTSTSPSSSGNTVDPRVPDVAVEPRRRPRARGREPPDRRPAVRQPQRRHARLRARRLPLHRDGRRRRRRRPRQPGPEHEHAARQDAADRRQRPDRDRPTRSRPTTRTSASPGATRSGRAACATRGASRSTALTGDLWIGDVGQDRYEEIDRRRPRRAGDNYGWRAWRATTATTRRRAAARRGKSLPVVEYAHTQGCAVTGGYVYRGSHVPALAAATSSAISARRRSGRSRDRRPSHAAKTLLRNTDFQISSFGEDEAASCTSSTSAARSTGSTTPDRGSTIRA